MFFNKFAVKILEPVLMLSASNYQLNLHYSDYHRKTGFQFDQLKFIKNIMKMAVKGNYWGFSYSCVLYDNDC